MFRVLYRRTRLYALVWFLIGGVLGLLISLVTATPAVTGIGAACGFLAGFVRGRATKYYECSDVHCKQLVSLTSVICSGCGGKFVGVITNVNDRLGALEDYVEQQASEVLAQPTHHRGLDEDARHLRD